MNHAAHLGCITLGMAMLACIPACEQNDPPPLPDTSTPTNPAPNDVTSLWSSAFGDARVLHLDSMEEPLRQAIEAARASAGSAQQRWTTQDDADRERWMICWAAPIDDERVEYLWVMPFIWSPYRVEGMLLNEPLEPMPRNWHRGDLIFFPADELADWVFQPPDGAEREGGTVLTLIEQQYGSPH